MEYICTDPSHPPILSQSGRRSLFREVSSAVTNLAQETSSEEEIVERVSGDVIQILNTPFRDYDDGLGEQHSRRNVAHSWKDVFIKIEGLGFLAGWFINECAQEHNARDLHYPLCHFAFESNRIIFPIINQLRSSLADDTFVYLRTLHETFVKSRFLKKYTEIDRDLPGRFIYYTNATYKRFYERFAKFYGQNYAKDMWINTEEHLRDKIHSNAKGPYAWAYPHIEDENGNTKKWPTFKDLIRAVDNNSTFSKFYYDVSAEKAHGKFIWNPLMVQPDARTFRFHPLNSENTGLVMHLMLPMYEEILENTASTCLTSGHATVRSVIEVVLQDIRDAVEAAITSKPDLYGHFDRVGLSAVSGDELDDFDSGEAVHQPASPGQRVRHKTNPDCEFERGEKDVSPG